MNLETLSVSPKKNNQNKEQALPEKEEKKEEDFDETSPPLFILDRIETPSNYCGRVNTEIVYQALVLILLGTQGLTYEFLRHSFGLNWSDKLDVLVFFALTNFLYITSCLLFIKILPLPYSKKVTIYERYITIGKKRYNIKDIDMDIDEPYQKILLKHHGPHAMNRSCVFHLCNFTTKKNKKKWLYNMVFHRRINPASSAKY